MKINPADVKNIPAEDAGTMRKIEQATKFVDFRFTDSACKNKEPAKTITLPFDRVTFEKL